LYASTRRIVNALLRGVVGESKKESLLNPLIVANVGIEDSEDVDSRKIVLLRGVVGESKKESLLNPLIVTNVGIEDGENIDSSFIVLYASTRRLVHVLFRGVVGERKKESLPNPPIVANVVIEDSEDLKLEFCCSNESFGFGALCFRPAVLFLPDGDFRPSDLRDDASTRRIVLLRGVVGERK
jgi:hypothetical protein